MFLSSRLALLVPVGCELHDSSEECPRVHRLVLCERLMEEHGAGRHTRHCVRLDDHHLACVNVHESVQAGEALDA